MSLREIELALVQQTHDDLLLKQLAQSLAAYMRNIFLLPVHDKRNISRRRYSKKFNSRGSNPGSVVVDPSIDGDSNARDEVLLGSNVKPPLTMSGSGKVTTGAFDGDCEVSTNVHRGPTTNAFDNYKVRPHPSPYA